jgi:hypothetical protein
LWEQQTNSGSSELTSSWESGSRGEALASSQSVVASKVMRSYNDQPSYGRSQIQRKRKHDGDHDEADVDRAQRRRVGTTSHLDTVPTPDNSRLTARELSGSSVSLNYISTSLCSTQNTEDSQPASETHASGRSLGPRGSGKVDSEPGPNQPNGGRERSSHPCLRRSQRKKSRRFGDIVLPLG